LNPEQTFLGVIDSYFLIKSDQKTEEKADFYNSIAGKAEQGLKIYVIYVVEV